MEEVKDAKTITILNDNPIVTLEDIPEVTRLETPLREAMDTHDLKSIKSAKSATSKTENESDSGSDDSSEEEDDSGSEADSDEIDIDETNGNLRTKTRASQASLEWS